MRRMVGRRSKTTIERPNRTVGVFTLALVLLLAWPPRPDAGPLVVDLIVQYEQLPVGDELERIAALGGVVRYQYEHLPMLALTVPVVALPLLAAGLDIDVISLDETVESFSLAARATANEPEPGSPG